MYEVQNWIFFLVSKSFLNSNENLKLKKQNSKEQNIQLMIQNILLIILLIYKNLLL